MKKRIGFLIAVFCAAASAQVFPPVTNAGTVTGASCSTAAAGFLACQVNTPTTNPAIVLSYATGQTAHQVMGTCGSATSFAPCALGLTDLPAGLGLTASPLSQFAATTSAQIAGVISDETGTGLLMFNASPTVTGTLTGDLATFNTLTVGGVSTSPCSATTGCIAGSTSSGAATAVAGNWLLNGLTGTSTIAFSSNGGTQLTMAASAAAGTAATNCASTNKVVTAISGTAAPTCTLLTSAYLPAPAGGGNTGIVASLSASTGSISNSLTQVLGYTVPTGTFNTGTIYSFDFWGTQVTSTSPGTDTFNIEIGSTTLSGNIVVTDTPAATASVTGQIEVRGLITIFASTVSASIIVCGTTSGALAATCKTNTTTTGTITAAQSNVIELVYVSGASTSGITFTGGYWKLEKQT